MIKSIDQKIINALQKTNRDKSKLIRCAVNYINRTDSLSNLSYTTRMSLYDAITADNSLYLLSLVRNRKNIDLGKDDYPPIIENYKNAYNKLMPTLPELQYSKNFTNRIWRAISKTLLNAKFESDWNTTPLQQKVKWLDEQASLVLDCYDPGNNIHKHVHFNPKIVNIDTNVATADKNNQLEFCLGGYSKIHDNISFPRYIARYFSDEYIAEHKPECNIDFESSKSFMCDGLHISQMEFDVEASDGNTHYQYNKDDFYLQYLSVLGSENLSKSTLSHELFHLITHRVSVWFDIAPKNTEKTYSFTLQDFKLHIASIAGYTDSTKSMEDYLANREEVAAHSIDKRFAKESVALKKINPVP